MSTSPKTGAQRVKESEARKRAAGLTRCVVWADPADHDGIKAHSVKLARKRLKSLPQQPALMGAIHPENGDALRK
jgi:hypothetical protein